MLELKYTDLTYISAYCDPASSKAPIKALRAQQAIVVVGLDTLTRIFVLYAWAGRLPVSKFYDKILDVNKKYHPRVFGIEANAMQAFVGDAVALEAKRREEKLPFVPVYPPTKVDKDFRIRTVLQPVIGWGRLFLHPGMHELRTQIATFPTCSLKDLIDALASAVALLPLRTTQQRRKSSEKALVKYLRESGATPSYIEERLEQIRRGGLHTEKLDRGESFAYTHGE